MIVTIISTVWTFVSQLMPYVLTSFASCRTWGAPFALIQLWLGQWSVSIVSTVGVAWWGVYQRLTVLSLSYIVPFLILSKFLFWFSPNPYLLCVYSLMKTLSLHSPSSRRQSHNPNKQTARHPDYSAAKSVLSEFCCWISWLFVLTIGSLLNWKYFPFPNDKNH